MGGVQKNRVNWKKRGKNRVNSKKSGIHFWNRVFYWPGCGLFPFYFLIYCTHYPIFSRLRRAISLLFSNLLCSLSPKISRLRRAYFFFFSITRDNTLPRCRSRQKYPIRNWVNSFLSNHHVDLIFLTDTIMPGIVDLIRNRVNSFLTDTVVEKSD